jgi:hypothetical protein
VGTGDKISINRKQAMNMAKAWRISESREIISVAAKQYQRQRKAAKIMAKKSNSMKSESGEENINGGWRKWRMKAKKISGISAKIMAKEKIMGMKTMKTPARARAARAPSRQRALRQ